MNYHLQTMRKEISKDIVISSKKNIPLYGKDNSVIGFLERIEIYAQKLRLIGWSAYPCSIVCSESTQPIKRRFLRGDVTAARPDLREYGAQVGFDETFDYTGGLIYICSKAEGGQFYYAKIEAPTKKQYNEYFRKSKSLLYRNLVLSSKIILKDIIKNKSISSDMIQKSILSRNGVYPKKVFESKDFLDSPAEEIIPNRPIYIVLPIYNAFDLLQESLARIKEYTDLPFKLVIIEDCSPDERVRPWIEKWSKENASICHLIKNEKNLGFIKSVNKGLDIARTSGGHAVIFNSDAFAPKNWLSRLIRPILENENVGSVTALSNDATIFSMPIPNNVIQIKEGLVDTLDRAISGIVIDHVVEVPTGVGFCMAMAYKALKKVHHFDTEFGKGYGEEVDWCQKIKRYGFINVAATNLFCEHRGGQSFGSATKLAALESSASIIRKRYPTFEDETRRFCDADPLQSIRAILATTWASWLHSEILLTHSLGGGVKRYTLDIVKENSKIGLPTIIAHLGGQDRIILRVHYSEQVVEVPFTDFDALFMLIKKIGQVKVKYVCGVGDPNPLDIPAFLFKISKLLGSSVSIQFHDFFPISPSYTLLNSKGFYDGVPTREETDPAHQTHSMMGEKITLEMWQDAWGAALRASHYVEVYSADSKEKVLGIWPEIKDKVIVNPHTLKQVPGKITTRRAKDGNIGVLGAIGKEKGAQIVSDISRLLHSMKSSSSIVIIGKLDEKYQLFGNSYTTGSYAVKDIPLLAEENNISCWLMPSIWPETFSYTTHEMLSTGLPVFSFDMGAQGGSVSEARNGYILKSRNPKDIYMQIKNVLSMRES